MLRHMTMSIFAACQFSFDNANIERIKVKIFSLSESIHLTNVLVTGELTHVHFIKNGMVFNNPIKCHQPI